MPAAYEHLPLSELRERYSYVDTKSLPPDWRCYLGTDDSSGTFCFCPYDPAILEASAVDVEPLLRREVDRGLARLQEIEAGPGEGAFVQKVRAPLGALMNQAGSSR